MAGPHHKRADLRGTVPVPAPRGGISWWLVCLSIGVALAGCRRRRTASEDPASASGVPVARNVPPAGPDWVAGTLQWDRWPIDVSWLNDGDRPAGRHGKLTVRDGRLTFEDGTAARFWGTNVVGRALFRSSREAVVRQAQRIAALGYNLVRIHHHDSEWVRPNIFQPGPSTQRLAPESREAIDWWIKCLKDQGVYVWLDLQVGRRYRPGDDIPGFDELAREGGDGRGFDYVNPRLEQLMEGFADDYLGHRSPFTGLAPKDDPAVVAILLSNEDDLTTHFGGRVLPAARNPVHQSLFEARATAFARTMKLPLPDSLHIWAPGPGKIVANELEARLFRRRIDHLRATGVTVPVVGTSYWGDEELSALPALTVGDVIDVHSYGDADALSANPRQAANFIDWIAAARVAGKPLTISEWDVEFPKRDRFTAPLYVASVGDLQGWDAAMLYEYTGEAAPPPTTIPVYATGQDPALTALTPAAAVMFRRQDVQGARRAYRFAPSREALYQGHISPATSRALRTLVEQSRLVIALPDLSEFIWDSAAPPPSPGEVVVTDADQDFLATAQDSVRSDTGELDRDWAAGVQTIDTPRSQAAAGRLAGRHIVLRDVELRMETAEATVAVTSLDGAPIASSGKLLLTVVARATASAGGKPPFLAEPVFGTVSLRSARPALNITPLPPGGLPGGDPQGPLGHASALPRSAGQYTIALHGLATHWFLIESASRPTGRTP